MLQIVSKKGVVANMIDSMDKSARVQFVAFVTWRRPRARLVPQIRSRSLGLSAISPKRIHRPSTSAQQGMLLQRINPTKAYKDYIRPIYKVTRLLMMMMSQVQRDRSSFAEPCYVIGDGRLCIFYKARAHCTPIVCARTWYNAHMAEEEHTASLTGGERMADDDAHIHGQVPQV